jgi:hypothetical protein
MTNPVIQTDIAEILREIKSDQKKLLEEANDLKLGQAEIKGEIKALDTKVEQLDKRIGNSELTNRGVLIGLIVVILGGAAKLFGFVSNP